jgi:hypothetical protein
MFGWGNKNVNTDELNRRNPVCAIVFHRMFDTHFGKEPGSEFFFLFTDILKQFETEFTLARLVASRISLERVRRDFSNTTAKLLSKEAIKEEATYRDGAYGMGRAAGLTTIARIIFAHAPAFGQGDVGLAHRTATLMIEDLHSWSGSSKNSLYLDGIRQSCVDYLTALTALAPIVDFLVEPFGDEDVGNHAVMRMSR